MHNVHTLGFGFGCTGIGLVRIGDVFGGGADFQGLAPGSSPTSGTVFSLFKGVLASECAHFVHLWAPSGAFFIAGRWFGRLSPFLVLVLECLVFGTCSWSPSARTA